MGKKYLVTGGTGFIGSALVRALVSQGASVRCLDNNWRGTPENLKDIKDRVEFVEGDIRKADTVAEATKGTDCVCHLAAINGTQFFYEKPDLVLEVAVKGMMNVIDACLLYGIRDLVVMSSSEVYQTPPCVPTDETVPLCVPDPMNPRYSYGGGKIISELLAINYGRNHFNRVRIIRPHNVYGPRMGWEHVIPQFVLRMIELSKVTSGALRFPIEGSGTETRAFVHISDFIDGTLKVIEKGEHLGIYHVGTDEETSIEVLAKKIAAVLKRDIELVPGELKSGGTLRRCPDISRVRALGYRSKVPLQKGLEETVRWYVENASLRPKHGR